MHRPRGSLTVEAAIVLPLITVVIFSMLMMSRVYYTYNQVDNALTQAAYSISNVAYPLKEIGFLDWQEAFDTNASEAETEVTDAFGNVMNITAGPETRQKYQNIYENMKDATKVSNKKSFEDWTRSFKTIREQFEEVLIIIEEIRTAIVQLLITVRDNIENSGMVVYSQLKQFLVRTYVKHYLEQTYSNDYLHNVLYIVSGSDGISYKGSNAFFSQKEDVNINNLITLNADYNIKLPIPFYKDNIHMKNSVTIRGLAGK